MTAQMQRMSQIVLDPTYLAGPIFDKELRVSSRRRRNYSLRFFYVMILAFFVVTVWLSNVDVQGNATVQQSRMAEAGKAIVSKVVLFQFIAIQILAAILLSNAISDELYHRTLGLLMTTPMNSFQIVMGKVLSRLLQLLQLLAITFPILAIVRVLGGVSWGYLLSSLCITLTAAIFAGSLSLLISIKNRRAYAVILQTLFLLFSFYVILPMVTQSLWGRGTGGFSSFFLLTRVVVGYCVLQCQPALRDLADDPEHALADGDDGAVPLAGPMRRDAGVGPTGVGLGDCDRAESRVEAGHRAA